MVIAVFQVSEKEASLQSALLAKLLVRVCQACFYAPGVDSGLLLLY